MPVLKQREHDGELRGIGRRRRDCAPPGLHRTIDSYSAFYENDRQTPSGLAGYLRERSLTRLFLAGLAFDFCVRYSAEDAHRAGFSVAVIEDACRSIDVDGSAEAARTALRGLDVRSISSGDFA